MNTQTRSSNTENTIALTEDTALVRALLDLLGREQANLVVADIDAIETIVDEKSQLLQRINLAARKRYEALIAQGYEGSEAGMDIWVQAQKQQNLNVAWATFQKSLGEAKELNRLNGMLIGKHFNRNQELLSHLQGGSVSDAVYGKDGQAKSKVMSRSGLVV